MSRVAVVLFNLGGPDTPEAVQPFLFNLFYDPAIIDVPKPVRWLLATLISRRRAPTAREIYAELGGGSPLLPNTQAQANALEAVLADIGEVRVFISMRYWHPRAEETARAVKDYRPDSVVLLPLYPQFSKTTIGSSLQDWQRAAEGIGLRAPSRTVCCYPTERGFVDEVATRLRPRLDEARADGRPRVLFSAHGLPKKVIAGGDPYQWQVERSVAAIVEALGEPDLDYVVCYQSRVGPLEWIGPATDDEIARAGGDGVPLVVVPVAFVSEHSETLVELDIEYAKLAREKGVPGYHRVPTVDAGDAFIQGLARLVRQALDSDRPIRSQDGGRICPREFGRCPQAPGAGD